MKQNNKAERVLKTKLKWMKRIARLRRKPKVVDPTDYVCYRTTGSPCSCTMCSPHKYKRAKMKKLWEERLYPE